MKFSNFVTCMKMTNKFIALYNSLNMHLVFVDIPEFDRIKNFIKTGNIHNKKLIQDLEKYHFFIIKDKEDEEYFQTFKSMLNIGVPKISMMYLLLTSGCNLNCDYCYIEQQSLMNKRKIEQMNKKTAQKAIDLFEQTTKSNTPKIIFYGGEPLLNKQTFCFAIKYARTKFKGKKLELSLVTNGSLIDDEVAKCIKDNKVVVSVSLDGSDAIANQHRKFVTGENVFDVALKGYKFLQSKGIQPGISCTITNTNVDKLDDIVKYFVNELNVKGMGMNPLLQIRGNKQIKLSSKKVNKALVDAFEYLRRKGVYEDRVMRKIIAFTENKIKINDCGACGNQIVIFPKGRVGICHAFIGDKKYTIGEVNKLRPRDIIFHPYIKLWANRTPFNLSECTYCEALSMCGGGCAHDGFIDSNSIFGLDKDFCLHSKYLLKWMIKKTFESSILNDKKLKLKGLNKVDNLNLC